MAALKKLKVREKLSTYACMSQYVTLDKIPTWKDQTKEMCFTPYKKNKMLNNKVSIFIDDITTLEVDAIVNSTDSDYSGAGEVDSAIHKAAGKALYYECQSIGELKVGEARISGGHKLPAKFVIHTAVPIDYDRKRLEECYLNSLAVAVEKGVRSIAFPSLYTRFFGYPNYEFAHVALRAVRNFLEENGSSVDLVAFCLFLHADVQIHEDLMKFYFPI